MENAEQKEPTDPTDTAEPTDPMDSTDPLEPIERIDPSDHRDHFDVCGSGCVMSLILPEERLKPRTRAAANSPKSAAGSSG